MHKDGHCPQVQIVSVLVHVHAPIRAIGLGMIQRPPLEDQPGGQLLEQIML
jgi:hypothetical protein